jgi:hypothetical protein
MTAKEPTVTMAGIEGYELTAVHPDVNGKWGGHRAMVAHFAPIGSESPQQQKIYLYALVGPYFEVGSWPDDTRPSAWQIVQEVVAALEEGLNRSQLHYAIVSAIERVRAAELQEEL